MQSIRHVFLLSSSFLNMYEIKQTQKHVTLKLIFLVNPSSLHYNCGAGTYELLRLESLDVRDEFDLSLKLLVKYFFVKYRNPFHRCC